jgi:hypothetical protein
MGLSVSLTPRQDYSWWKFSGMHCVGVGRASEPSGGFGEETASFPAENRTVVSRTFRPYRDYCTDWAIPATVNYLLQCHATEQLSVLFLFPGLFVTFLFIFHFFCTVFSSVFLSPQLHLFWFICFSLSSPFIWRFLPLFSSCSYPFSTLLCTLQSSLAVPPQNTKWIPKFWHPSWPKNITTVLTHRCVALYSSFPLCTSLQCKLW